MTARLMIVEDDLELQELYAHMLEGTGWEIEPVHDGAHALARLLEVVPDVLILDVILDEMGGDELYRRMRRHPDLQHVPVVVVTVLSAERCRGLIKADDSTTFLRKPFHRRALLAAVHHVLHGGDGQEKKG